MKYFFLLTIACWIAACGPAQSEPPTEPAVVQEADSPKHFGVLTAGFVGIDGVYNSELMAPYDILQHTVFRDSLNYITPFVVSPEGASFVTFEGLTIAAHHSFAAAPPIDILVIPSAEGSMTTDLEDDVLMGWLKQAVAEAKYVITLCDGAFPLAATGALAGRVATTFPADRARLAELFPDTNVRYDASFVVDGKYITSVGGALSYEPALYLVEHLYGVESARRTAQGLVLDWDVESIRHFVAAQ
ncbi:MAG TPA: DJ-1/PfpI family protein [Rhodothermales bacterium]|nr:DJ-1/PfpI family protein [Rhodothermales bacterium]